MKKQKIIINKKSNILVIADSPVNSYKIKSKSKANQLFGFYITESSQTIKKIINKKSNLSSHKDCFRITKFPQLNLFRDSAQ